MSLLQCRGSDHPGRSGGSGDGAEVGGEGGSGDGAEVGGEGKISSHQSADWRVKLIGVNGLGPRVIWKVKTSEMFEQCTAKGDSFDSPEFSVGMLSKFVIRFLPVGSINSLDGKVGLYIMQTLKEMCFPGELEVVVSAVGNEFAAVSASYYWRTIFDDDGDYGTHSLMDRFAKDVGDRHQSPSRGRRQRSHHRIGR